MTNQEMRNMEDGIAHSRQLAKLQLQSTIAMVLSAAVAFVLTGVVAPGIDALGLAIAAATGFTVSVCCEPNTYRRRNGSLVLALFLIAFMWAVPVVVILTSFSG